MLINCAVYRDGKREADISAEQIPAALASPDTFVWVSLKDPDPEQILLVQRVFDLPDLAVEDTLHGGQRPKVEEYDQLLFASLKVAERRQDTIHYGDLFIFTHERFVLSIRNDVRRGFADVRARAECENDLLRLGPAFVLYALTDAVVDRYFPIVDELEIRLEEVEALLFRETPSRETMLTLHELKQDVAELRHSLPPMMDEALFRLYGGRAAPALATELKDYFRDVHDHLHRIVLSLEALRDSISMATQVNLSLISLEQSEVSKKLAAWAAIFAMMTTFAGIWGMNFEHMPELKWVWGYPAAMLLMVGVALLLYRRFRKVGWL
ncbi:MAG: magnesium and cobalt transport protein CorA [Lautropia sp.]|nr:magnesium and cobalt transport protein CorA [Lautropia sp.]